MLHVVVEQQRCWFLNRVGHKHAKRFSPVERMSIQTFMEKKKPLKPNPQQNPLPVIHLSKCQNISATTQLNIQHLAELPRAETDGAAAKRCFIVTFLWALKMQWDESEKFFGHNSLPPIVLGEDHLHKKITPGASLCQRLTVPVISSFPYRPRYREFHFCLCFSFLASV